MSTTVPQLKTPRTATHFDVLIIGAGISGIGAAYHFKTRLPGKTFAILEGRDALGGTWDLFRYPGIRSDSDLHTFAYEFKPWTRDNAIADADEILDYLHETVEENDLARHIRFGHKVLGASWSSERALWTVQVQDTRHRRARRADLRAAVLRRRLLRLRRGLHAALRGSRELRRHDRPPAALARGPRLPGQASGRHRQRRDGRHPDPGDGRARRARDDAPALAELRDDAPGQGSDRQRPATDPARRCSPTGSRAG